MKSKRAKKQPVVNSHTDNLSHLDDDKASSTMETESTPKKLNSDNINELNSNSSKTQDTPRTILSKKRRITDEDIEESIKLDERWRISLEIKTKDAVLRYTGIPENSHQPPRVKCMFDEDHVYKLDAKQNCSNQKVWWFLLRRNKEMDIPFEFSRIESKSKGNKKTKKPQVVISPKFPQNGKFGLNLLFEDKIVYSIDDSPFEVEMDKNTNTPSQKNVRIIETTKKSTRKPLTIIRSPIKQSFVSRRRKQQQQQQANNNNSNSNGTSSSMDIDHSNNNNNSNNNTISHSKEEEEDNSQQQQPSPVCLIRLLPQELQVSAIRLCVPLEFLPDTWKTEMDADRQVTDALTLASEEQQKKSNVKWRVAASEEEEADPDGLFLQVHTFEKCRPPAYRLSFGGFEPGILATMDLNMLAVSDLRSLCKQRKLDMEGKKTEIIQRLLQADPSLHISDSTSNNNKNGSSNNKELYNDLTAAQLKELLKSQGLPFSGTKNQMITRLMNCSVAPPSPSHSASTATATSSSSSPSKNNKKNKNKRGKESTTTAIASPNGKKPKAKKKKPPQKPKNQPSITYLPKPKRRKTTPK